MYMREAHRLFVALKHFDSNPIWMKRVRHTIWYNLLLAAEAGEI